jgi:hypothetical protein
MIHTSANIRKDSDTTHVPCIIMMPFINWRRISHTQFVQNSHASLQAVMIYVKYPFIKPQGIFASNESKHSALQQNSVVKPIYIEAL